MKIINDLSCFFKVNIPETRPPAVSPRITENFSSFYKKAAPQPESRDAVDQREEPGHGAP
ncbi:MAG: hypothetical protein D3906_11130 [Candidatus Electrothrix sp. AUS1_2]|nr:hypothetical protein [Candidatus Electrothrix sp. AUS1_2]